MVKSKRDDNFCETNENKCQRKFVNVILPPGQECTANDQPNNSSEDVSTTSTSIVALLVTLVAVILTSIGTIGLIWHR